MAVSAHGDKAQLRRMYRISIRGRKSARYVAWVDLVLSFFGFTVAIVWFYFEYRVLVNHSVITKDGIQLNISISVSMALIWVASLPLMLVSFLTFTAASNLLSATEPGVGVGKARVKAGLWLTLTTYSFTATLFLCVLSSPILARTPVLAYLQQHIFLVSYVVIVLVRQIISLIIVGIYFVNLRLCMTIRTDGLPVLPPSTLRSSLPPFEVLSQVSSLA